MGNFSTCQFKFKGNPKSILQCLYNFRFGLLFSILFLINYLLLINNIFTRHIIYVFRSDNILSDNQERYPYGFIIF